jgi:putative DNA primase/helicase
MNLLPSHREHLHKSGLTDETIAAAGVYSIVDPTEAARLLNWEGDNGPAPAIALPVFGINGEIVQTVLRPDSPRVRENGSVAKYEQPLGEHHRVYFPPLIARDRLLDATVPIYWTEGIKKALAIVQAGRLALSMQGVTVWHDSEHRRANKGRPDEWHLHPDLQRIPLRGRIVCIAFDGGDTSQNPQVILAETRVARMLLDAGADTRLIRVPFVEGGSKVGIDDYLAGLAR